MHTVLGNSGEGRLIRACLQLPPGSLAIERCRISGGRDRGGLIYGPCAIRTTFSGWFWVTVSTSGKLLPLHLPSTHLRKPRLPVILPLHRPRRDRSSEAPGYMLISSFPSGGLCLCKTQMESCSPPVFTATLTPRRVLPPPLEFLSTFVSQNKAPCFAFAENEKKKKTHRTTSFQGPRSVMQGNQYFGYTEWGNLLLN